MYLSIPSKSAPAWECLARDYAPGSPEWASTLASAATLNGKHTQPQSWQRAWKKDRWMQHLSGPTFSPSTLQPGLEQWIASLRDSRARTCPLRGDGPGLMANEAASSSTSSILPTLAVRDTSFWRTSQASLVPPPPLWTKPKGLSTSARPPASWENWPTAGGMRNGSLFQRPTWAPAMGGSDGFAGLGGAWTTPDVCSGARDMSKIDPEAQKRADTKRTTGLPTEAAYWATPDCNTSTYSNGKMGPNIREQATSWNANSAAINSPNPAGATDVPTAKATGWPTPRGTDGTKGGPNQAGSRGDLMLPSAAAQWPTPRTTDTNQGRGAELIGTAYYRPSPALKSGILVGQANLSDVVQQWPTPAARDSKGANSAEHALITGGGRKHMDQLSNFVAHSSHLAQPTPDGPPSCESGPDSPPPSTKRLNPAFGEWLMGWPVGWTIADPSASSASETAFWRSALQQRLCNLLDE